jgi:CDP-glucose 4,6-dehydratase
MHTFDPSLRLFNDIYRGKRVLVTGHTGFKGSWLCSWLTSLGADVLGFSLAPDTEPNHFELIASSLPMQSVIGDIRDLATLQKTWIEFQPEIVFHLAAQPLVRLSYDQPIETLHSNVIGTANVFEACRHTPSVRAIVNITSDKCYENKEWVWGYRENDPMGGYDPYSASKGCAELVTSAYRNSFFHPDEYGQSHNVLLASVRAGNVIGGGDWARDRIITDLVTAASRGEKLSIRNPWATRPWQHVLEPLSGYLFLGQRLLEGRGDCAGAWNFGPNDDGAITVLEVVKAMQKCWDRVQYVVRQNNEQPHEANLLKLDCSKARMRLFWKGIWDADMTFHQTASWYRTYYQENSLLTFGQLDTYVHDALDAGAVWVESPAE